MNLEDKLKIGQEVSPSVPTATEDTHAINLGQAGVPNARTGTIVDLSTFGGTLNAGSPSAALEYTVSNLRIRGHRLCSINAPSEPKVWTGNYEEDGTTKIYYPKIKGATFTPNVNMEMVVESPDGVNVRYFFLEL